MTSDFDRIKERLDLRTIILQETGLQMKGPHLDSCPFCNGHECFSIKDTQYKCFQCPDDSSSGDIFTFIQKFKSLDAHESLKYAASLAGITLKEKKKAEVKLSSKERIFMEAAIYYHLHMLDNGGKQYLMEQRGHKEDVLRKMQVGWTDGGLVEHLRKKGFDEIEIKASGLAKIREQDGVEHLVDYFLKNVAIFPHFEDSRVLHFTIKDPHKKLKYQLLEKDRIKDWRFYNQLAIEKFKEVIVVEGENDLLSVLDSGTENVIGLIGQPAEYQLKALQAACRHKHLYLWLDNDEG
ncbi:MAG: CHC2 zinc finger domain-containing protein, partial [Nitrospirae bacterium]|nr:CHC2 zinc finger domain-containing protein [Nitrospirota bacterium]